MESLKKHALALLALIFLAGCGGGGGGGGGAPSFSITYAPAALNGTFDQGQLPASFNVVATTHGSTSATTFYVYIIDSGTTFAAGPVSITQLAVDQYRVTLTTQSNLGPGAHTGTLTVRVCTTSNCSSELTSNTLPYSITVETPGFDELEPLESGGVAGSSIRFVVWAPNTSGSQLYANIVDSEGGFTTSGLALVSYGGDQHALFLPVPDALPATRHQGTMSITLCPDAACSSNYGTHDMPYSVQVFRVLAGQIGVQGYQDGAGAQALFKSPGRMDIDPSGNVFVSEPSSVQIRMVTPEGVVSTPYKRFDNAHAFPDAVAVDAGGNVFFAHDGSCRISKRAPDGTVSLFANICAANLTVDSSGNLWSASYATGYVYKFAADGTQLRSRNFGHASDVAIDPSGNAIVGNGHYNPNEGAYGVITTWTPADETTTLPKKNWGPPTGLDIEGGGNLIVSAVYNFWIVDPQGVATYLGKNQGTYLGGNTLELGGLAVGADGKRLVVSDKASHVLLETTLP